MDNQLAKHCSKVHSAMFNSDEQTQSWRLHCRPGDFIVALHYSPGAYNAIKTAQPSCLSHNLYIIVLVCLFVRTHAQSGPQKFKGHYHNKSPELFTAKLESHSRCIGLLSEIDDGSILPLSMFFFFFFFFFQVQPYNRKYRSIGHRVWSMSLNFLTEL